MRQNQLSTRIKRVLEILNSYSFNLYYIKGKDVAFSDFLTRQRHDSNPHEIIQISFNMQYIPQSNYYNIGKEKVGKYLVQTWSQTKSNGIHIPKVHSMGKGLDLNILPEKQVIKPIIISEMKGISQKKTKIKSRQSRFKMKN